MRLRKIQRWLTRLNAALAGFILAADAEDLAPPAEEEDGTGAPKFFYGGQAVMEGVMMRSAYSAAVVVRSPKMVAIQGYDPVAYFEAGAAIPGTEEFEQQWEGAYWRFASADNRDAFAATPKRYAPRYGGLCADAVRAGGRTDPDPTVWAIHADRLYLYKDAAARDAWMQDSETSAETADAAWESMGDKRPSAKGAIMVHEQELNAKIYRGVLPKIPILRGLIMLWDALGLGGRALMWSADIALSEEEEDIDLSFSGALGIGTMIFSLLLGTGLFVLVPAAVAGGVENVLKIKSALLVNLIEGLIRLALVIGYMWLIGRIPDIKRLFTYHGAEHKTINAYEAGAPLTPEAVAPYPIEHTRCGTGFLLVVVAVSVLVFAFLGHYDNLILRLGSRILLVPLVAGIAYEWIRYSARNLDKPLIAALIKPNLWLQRLTTNEPTPDILEVGIMALQRVLSAEPNLAAAAEVGGE